MKRILMNILTSFGMFLLGIIAVLWVVVMVWAFSKVIKFIGIDSFTVIVLGGLIISILTHTGMKRR